MSLKKLAGDTAWYGLSSIFARFLNYLLTPYLTYKLSAAVFGEMSIVYSAIPFLNVVFTYGMETAFFRFSSKEGDEHAVFNTASLSLFFTTLLFTAAMLVWQAPIAQLLRLSMHPEFIAWAAWIIALDTLTTLPFAKLRLQGRPRKYASIRVLSIFINIGAVYFFYSMLPGLAKTHPGSFYEKIYHPELGAGYYIIAGLIQSAFAFVLLLPEFFSVRFEMDAKLWKQMVLYSLPLMVAGFGGMINETFDRIMLGWWAPVAGDLAKKTEVGIYSACYKLSILITLFVQTFRMGAEPFFFAQAKGENAPKTYARVMKFFVIAICCMFLFVMFYLDYWKHFIRNQQMWVGLKVVPILLVANMCLGVYYNLSIWYKLSNTTRAGATITIIGALLTLGINWAFIPYFSYMACAWATLICYGSMMLISYFWGQKVYPVPYATKKLVTYFVIMLILYFMHWGVCQLTTAIWIRFSVGTIFFFMYLSLIVKVEAKELKKFPVIGKFIK